MKRTRLLSNLVFASLVFVLVFGLVAVGRLPNTTQASSHREAPMLIGDPLADNTDIYTFVSPDKPDTVTILANFVPFENPGNGPNFYRFGDDVLYEIHVDNVGDAVSHITYQIRFTTRFPSSNRATFGSASAAANADAASTPGASRIVARNFPIT